MDEDSWIIGLKDFVIRLSAVLVSIRREHKRRLGAAPRLISNLCYCLLFISRTAVILVLLCSADINKMNVQIQFLLVLEARMEIFIIFFSSGQDKLWINCSPSNFFIFFRLAAQKRHFRDKKYCILTFRDKTASIFNLL